MIQVSTLQYNIIYFEKTDTQYINEIIYTDNRNYLIK
jgi:hypothetical protein